MAGPDGSFVSTGACNLGVPGSNPGPVRADICHREFNKNGGYRESRDSQMW